MISISKKLRDRSFITRGRGQGLQNRRNENPYNPYNSGREGGGRGGGGGGGGRGAGPGLGVEGCPTLSMLQ